MPDILHILNGDTTGQQFKETGLSGETIIWREVLSEGPLGLVPDADFWLMRSNWICRSFEETPEGYEQKVINEVAQINEPFQELNLWFDNDLHCQVNMLGAMQLLQSQTDLTERDIYLVCPQNDPATLTTERIAELPPDQMENLYDNRVQLSDYDFTLACEAWQFYVKNDSVALEQWLQAVPFWGSLHVLKPALQAHIQRLQTDTNGLTLVEQQLLKLYQAGLHSLPEIYPEFSKAWPLLGMGDAEVYLYLKKLTIKGCLH